MKSRIEIVPSGAALGVEVRGIDVGAGPSDAALETIARAWTEHLVLVLRGQSLSDSDLVAFARHFGELDPPGPNPYGGPIHPAQPELNVISNIVHEGRPIGNLGAGEAVWHADLTYQDVPPLGGILYGIEIPPEGGNTYFANLCAAYDELAEDLRARIEGLVAIHDASHNSAGMRRKGYEEVTDVRRTPGARHPLVRTDPDNGRRSLFLGRRPRSYVVDMAVADSEALLDTLWAHATQKRFTFTHQWQVGDVVMWKNLVVLHRRDAFDAESRRRLHRAQIKGRGHIN